MSLRLILFVCTIPMGYSWADRLFYGSSDVTELSDLNFNELVLESNDLWLVQFYADWCPAAKKVVPQYKKLATSLKDSGSDIHIGEMDIWYEGAFYDELHIESSPTFKFYGRDKFAPITYDHHGTDDITAEHLENFLTDHLRNERETTEVLTTTTTTKNPISSEQRLGVHSGVSDKELSSLLVLITSTMLVIQFMKT